jgi:GcrA cell cycle regulator
MTTWTPKNIEIIKTMWLDGASFGQIAAVLGCSRNKVCGKINRLGLMRSRHGSRTERRPAAAPPVTVPLLIPPKRAAAVDAKRPPRIVEPAAEPRNLTIYDLTRLDCRAIVSPDRAAVTHYCGHPIRPGSAYCPAHHARFHTKGLEHATSPQADRLANHHPRIAQGQARTAAAVVARGAAKPRG